MERRMMDTATAARTVDGRVIGTGKFGPITLKLLTEFRKLVHEEGTLIFPNEKVAPMSRH
jgi:hypothetical protein